MFHTDTYKKEITADHRQQRLQYLSICMHRRVVKVRVLLAQTPELT